jgi:hypothetical protein
LDSSNVKTLAKKTEATENAEATKKKAKYLSPDNDSSVLKTGSMSDEHESECAWSDPDEEADGMDISLNAIKRRVLGRDIETEYHHESPSNAVVDGSPANIKNLVQRSNTMPLQGSSSLKAELSCAICYEVFYQPISLNCGHSFCRECLKWWLAHSHHHRASRPHPPPPQQQQQHEAVVSQHEKCPTCRRGLLLLTCDDDGGGGGASSLGVNTALRACVATLFPAELEARVQAEVAAKKKATAGENGGAHSGGYVLLTDLEESGWITVRRDAGAARFSLLSARRSIVLDEEDQRMQLALSLRREPHVSSEGVVQVELCLLTMEEDEADDGGGFPLVVREEEDDEHFICLEERLLSCIEAKARIGGNFGAKPTFVPIARRGGGLGQQEEEEEGVVQFRIDVGGTPALEKAVAFCFRHEETGAELEIKLPAGERPIDVDGSTSRETDNRRTTEAIKAGSENNEVEYVHSKDHVSNLDEFEDDGFVVMEEDEEEDYENNYESEEETHDEEDVCCLCQDGGDLIVCDGGDNLEGCGRNFHVRCIKRKAVPPGDWVCQTCANSFEFNVGIEGHEFAIEGEEDGGGAAVEEEKAEGDDDTFEPPKGRLKRKRNSTLEEDNDDSDDEEFEAMASSRSKATRKTGGDDSDGSLVVLPQQKSKVSKKLCVWDSDDD